MLLRLLFTGLLFLFSCITIAQTTISEVLDDKLQELAPGEKIRVQVVLKSQADMAALRDSLMQARVAVSDRPRIVISRLKSVSGKEQQELKAYIETFESERPGSSSGLKAYYIVNLLVLDATRELVQAIAGHPLVEAVEWDQRFRLVYDPPVEKREDVKRSVGGHEPGLALIGAPFMWKLGYTGLGRCNYTIDTGIWPQHPALSRQWKGNYFPQDWCWNSYDRPEPGDKPDSHGTHVTGIVLGLDTLTKDTIGVAFNASYMVADPIVEDENFIKPIVELIGAFEFALNPDGDESTTDDVPDVITNSWGIAAFEPFLCLVPFIPEMLNALDAAGIAVEFSAGNEGPGSGTIGLPQYVSVDTLSLFTVGALSASDITIAGFSSRGPTGCNVPGNPPGLKIKPEVSAPGVIVRSSVQRSTSSTMYTYYTGTSMAGPHVSGAILLLKEAFPFLSGRELLNALYQSATDLGEPGEDNSYGRGLINLEAAFHFLSQQHTAVAPNTSPVDLAVENLLFPGTLCPGDMEVRAVIANYGSVASGGGQLVVRFNGSLISDISWPVVLEPGERDTVLLATVPVDQVVNEVFVTLYPTGDLVERDVLNNHCTRRKKVPVRRGLPFFEGFEQGNLPTIHNPDDRRTWDTILTGGLSGSRYSAVMDMLGYAPRGEADDLISPLIEIPAGTTALNLRFDHAYRKRSFYDDSLKVLISTDCGRTWSSEVFAAGGTSLATTDTNIILFVPSKLQHWRTSVVSLDAFLQNEHIMVAFKALSGFGSRIYLDNIAVYTHSDPTLVPGSPAATWECYPNPTSGDLWLVFPETVKNGSWIIYDLQGRIQASGNIRDEQTLLPLSGMQAGIYLLSVNAREMRSVKRIVKY